MVDREMARMMVVALEEVMNAADVMILLRAGLPTAAAAVGRLADSDA